MQKLSIRRRFLSFFPDRFRRRRAFKKAVKFFKKSFCLRLFMNFPTQIKLGPAGAVYLWQAMQLSSALKPSSLYRL